MTTKTKIMVISRDPVMVRFLVKNLGVTGYEIVTRRDTDERLKEAVDEEVPNLIILDIMMPSLDGVEICLRIRQWCLTPIMMLSTWGAGGNRVRGLNLGADSYLTEPFGIDALLVRIKEQLRRNLAAANLLSNIRPGVSWER